MVALALKRETYAAKLADKAAQMESAIVTGGKMPKEVEELIEGPKSQHSAIVAAHAAATEADVETPEEGQQEEFHKYVKSNMHKEEFDKYMDHDMDDENSKEEE